jgi:hypothetical protein
VLVGGGPGLRGHDKGDGGFRKRGRFRPNQGSRRPRIRSRAAGCLRTRHGMVLLHWHDVEETEDGKFGDISCRTSKVSGFSVAFCGPPGRRPADITWKVDFEAGRRCSSRYSRYGVSTFSIHFMNARTRRDRLLRCATTRDTGIARRRKSGMISTSAPLRRYWPIPKSGA